MEAPAIADKIKDLTSEKLGREAIIRKIKNRDEYFILDLAFSYFQKADRNKRNDYRSGYLYLQKGSKNHLLFVIAHSPIMINFFSDNFDYSRFREILINTSNFRDEHFIRFAQSADNKVKYKTENFHEFLDKLDGLDKKDFRKQVFTKSTTKDSKSGNIFVINLASGFNNDDLNDIIEESWDLFMWLYPSKPIFKRNASLNRSLIKVNRQCEIDKIMEIPNEIMNKNCSGQIEGAHIVPHKDGGSDKLENGLWLCNLHHRLTEGKLVGQRDLKKINVKYKEK
jgi:hypothetical protein